MAGFFGMFDHAKPGKGVPKDERPKGRFVHFWKLFIRKFWRLIQLNLLYLLFCLPVVTIGPATAGATVVLRNLANEEPVFMFSDFWDGFKKNWKQSLVYSILFLAFGAMMLVSIQFYSYNAKTYAWMYALAGLSMFGLFLLVLMSFYAMLMIVTLQLPLPAILKNAAILAFLCLKTNLLTLLFTGLLGAASVLLFPYSILPVLLLVPAWSGFIICYNSYPGIKKYAIDPYYAGQKATSPEGAGGTESDTGTIDAVFREPAPKEED